VTMLKAVHGFDVGEEVRVTDVNEGEGRILVELLDGGYEDSVPAEDVEKQ